MNFYNRVKFTTATTGTGTLTVASAVSKFRTPAQASVSNGASVRYVIEEGSNWEIGWGVYTVSGTTLSRNVLQSSNSDALISLGGSAVVRFTVGAQDFLSDIATVDVASASTCAIGAATSRNVKITGTTTITAFDTVDAGIWRHGYFSGALTLTYNATSLILPSAANITTVAGDSFVAISLGSGNWKVLIYQRASGAALAASSSLSFYGISSMYAVPSSGWSWDNQKTAVITSSGGVESLAAVSSGSEWQLRYRTPSNSNWQITVLITSLSTSTNTAFGIGFRDSGGKLIMLTMYFNNAQFVAYRWNSSTSFSGAALSSVGVGAVAPIWMRLKYDGTNVVFYYSIDSQVWHQLHSETRATFLASGTPNFCWGADGIGGALKVSLLSYEEVAA